MQNDASLRLPSGGLMNIQWKMQIKSGCYRQHLMVSSMWLTGQEM